MSRYAFEETRGATEARSEGLGWVLLRPGCGEFHRDSVTQQLKQPAARAREGGYRKEC